MNELILNRQYDPGMGDTLLAEVCSSSPGAYAISACETLSPHDTKSWKSYMRRAARHLDGVRFRDRKGQLYPKKETKLTEEAIRVKNRAALALKKYLEDQERHAIGDLDTPSLFIAQARYGRGNQDKQTSETSKYALKAFDGDIELIKRVQATLVPIEKPASFMNLWARQSYQKHLGHIRVLQNLHLLRALGIRPSDLVNKKAVEFGPGVGGLYPVLLANGCETSVVDKNAAVLILPQ